MLCDGPIAVDGGLRAEGHVTDAQPAGLDVRYVARADAPDWLAWLAAEAEATLAEVDPVVARRASSRGARAISPA